MYNILLGGPIICYSQNCTTGVTELGICCSVCIKDSLLLLRKKIVHEILPAGFQYCYLRGP